MRLKIVQGSVSANSSNSSGSSGSTSVYDLGAALPPNLRFSLTSFLGQCSPTRFTKHQGGINGRRTIDVRSAIDDRYRATRLPVSTLALVDLWREKCNRELPKVAAKEQGMAEEE